MAWSDRWLSKHRRARNPQALSAPRAVPLDRSYAYLTYEGSGVKRDVPVAEQPLILELAQQAARTQAPQTDIVRGSREALIITSCPLAAPAKDLAAWR